MRRKLMNKIEQAVILAGGYGTRLKPFTDTNPKPMYLFEGKPFLEYLVEQVKSFGITEIVMLLGYLPEKIMDYFGTGEKWGVSITYSITPVEYDTGLRIKGASELLHQEFLLLYCDNYCPINYEALLQRYRQSNGKLCFTAYENLDGYTKNNLRISETGLVEVYDKKRVSSNLQGVDIGYALVNKNVLSLLPEENHNFESVVYPALIEKKESFAEMTAHRYYSVGSWERIELTKDFFSPRKFIFLDRDGTLNVRAPQARYIENSEDFIWLDGAKDAIKQLNDANYTVILVSNQPGIARGNLTESTLNDIHHKMQKDLNQIGAKIDHIYYCPHNWEEGCPCRKPKPGMFYQAQKDLSVDLTKCIMIGDDERDIDAASRAGVRGVFVDENFTLMDAVNAEIYQKKGCNP